MHNTLAAEEIVPVLMGWFNPSSVIDVGCGLGTWLYIFQLHGVSDILGIDGPHLDTAMLLIDKDKVLLTNLEEEFGIDRKFNLALCLEVAEHLSDASADRFIKSLTKLSDIIIFSAAVPNQDGQNHINEQWIDYWKLKFEAHGFILTDELRPVFWENQKVEWWYRQNMVIAMKKDIHFPFNVTKAPLNLVHPDLFGKKNETINYLKEIHKVNNQIIGDLMKENELLRKENNLLENKLTEIESELKTIYDSITWKLMHKLIIIPVSIIIKSLKSNSSN